MLFLIATAAVAATAAAPPPERGLRPVAAQATASVRIVSGVRLKLDSPSNANAPRAHHAKVSVNGEEKPARLIEFE